MMHRATYNQWWRGGGEHTGDGQDALSYFLKGGTGNASAMPVREGSEGIPSGDDAGADRVGCLAML